MNNFVKWLAPCITSNYRTKSHNSILCLFVLSNDIILNFRNVWNKTLWKSDFWSIVSMKTNNRCHNWQVLAVHTASALFYVAFVFNSVYLFCPCCFYCLFCVISVSPCFLNYDFLDYHFGLLLPYSFADVLL